jgi:putative Holliday junction resolvase
MGRIVGLDVGERRVGIAISDATGTLARPLDVVAVQALGPSAVAAVSRRLLALAAEEDGVDRVVVGLPRRLDGTTGPLTARVEAFARSIEARAGRPVVLQDERLSSVEAEQRLAVREKDWRVRKARLDAAAAAVILQDYLDAQRPTAVMDGSPNEVGADSQERR